jgi:hypothetical protein
MASLEPRWRPALSQAKKNSNDITFDSLVNPLRAE